MRKLRLVTVCVQNLRLFNDLSRSRDINGGPKWVTRPWRRPF